MRAGHHVLMTRWRRSAGMSSCCERRLIIFFVVFASASIAAPTAMAQRCADGTAYASLLSAHDGQLVGAKTFLADPAHKGSLALHKYMSSANGGNIRARHEDKLSRQVQLLLVLVRSLRRVESACRRDFVLLLGSSVILTADQRGALEAEGVLFRSTPPTFLGVPTADKLDVWRLTQYRRVVVFDADVMVLRPIDDLFHYPEELVIAHHPYDQLQAQCDVAIASRAVAALFVVTPSLHTHEALLGYIRRRFRPDQLTYSDQTGLACFFGSHSGRGAGTSNSSNSDHPMAGITTSNGTRVMGSMRTLPCSFLYEAGNPLVAMGMRRYKRECVQFGAQHVRQQCLAGVPNGCANWEGARACEASRRHLETSCAWTASFARTVRAVHFKGKWKPWPSMHQRNTACRHARYGALVAGWGARPSSAVPTGKSRSSGTHYLEREVEVDFASTRLVWNGSARPNGTTQHGACISTRHGAPVFFRVVRDPRGRLPVHVAKCCTLETMLSAMWHRELMRRGGAKGVAPPIVQRAAANTLSTASSDIRVPHSGVS